MTGSRPDAIRRIHQPRPATVVFAALLTLAAAWPPAASAADPFQLAPYNARYAIYRNGKLTGKADVSLEKHGERWIIRSESSGTHGLARILAARDDENVVGHLFEGRFRPDLYHRHTRVAGIDDRWAFDFDWDQWKVEIRHNRDDPLTLDMLNQDALDPLSLKLEMRQQLAAPDPHLNLDMVEEDEIERQVFRVLAPEWMETSLGCLRTTVVEKVRHNSTRYTRAWHAPELDFIEVRIEHGKTDGNHLEMRITELSMNGVEVTPLPGCAARQAGGDTDEPENAVPND